MEFKTREPEHMAYFDPPLIYNDDNDGKAPTYLDHAVYPWPMTKKRKPLWKSETEYLCADQPQPCDYVKRDDKANDASEAIPVTHVSRWMASKSPLLESSAEFICSQLNLVGPHWANLYESKFCNMVNRSVWDICGGTTTSNCFDMEKQVLWGPPSISNASNETVSILGGPAAGEKNLTSLLQLFTRLDMNDG